MIFLEELRKHYSQTKLAILEAVQNKIAEEYPVLKDTMKIKRNRLEIDNEICSGYIDLEDASFKVCFDDQPTYCYNDMQILLDDIGDEINSNAEES